MGNDLNIGMKKCRDCGVPKTANKDNFNVLRTSEDGFSPICKPCQGARIKAGVQRKKLGTKAYKNEKTHDTAAAVKKVFEKADKSAATGWLHLNFVGQEDLLKKLHNQACQQLRSPEMQALFMLREVLQ